MADHRFLHGELNDDAVRLEATLGSRTVSIALVNPRVPHLVPTADNGDPRLYLYVTLKDRTGEAVDAYKEILAPQQDTALPPGKQIRYDYPLMDSVRQVHVSVQYRPAWTQEKREILQQVIERPAR
ncbi:MAG: hypothetical protein COV67_06185 [Nitrospinae bacterium CG11_big_fil_rev_8_21_14_0_20_56_8]|nr:MAG: hypothetical protein COV67_06185 [Nitrospinae bacterium CG11_big_fil_rev_8_21_14_0_20_56_8]